MTNKEIAKKFSQLAKIMELHGENTFKIRSYHNAYNTLRKIEQPLIEMSYEELSKIKGVGKAIAEKILELGETGELKTYQKYANLTPSGVIEMLNVRGLGAKKALVIWKEMGIDTIGELLYACHENRLIELKGFGKKTQEQLKNQLQYYIDSKGKYLYGYIISGAETLIQNLENTFPDDLHHLVGGLRRLDPIVESIEVLTTVEKSILEDQLIELGVENDGGSTQLGNYPLNIHYAQKSDFGSSLFLLSGTTEYTQAFDAGHFAKESEVFSYNKRIYLPPELRDCDARIIDISKEEIIAIEDIKGVVHTHSTFSDGMHSVEEMAFYADALGYEYLVMSDHSVSAFYANGMREEKVWQQFEVIEDLNKKMSNFKIYKGIEADILPDGSMDYGNDFLQNFEVVIASIHSILRMDKEKATNRLIKAIENPYTHILGHPTGRLLLSREGYPIDHMKIIDACAANGMVIELNANPMRLDLDCTWIPYAQEKGVLISINPDSHNKESISYLKFGVNAARKGLLTKDKCLNTKNLQEFEKWVNSLK